MSFKKLSERPLLRVNCVIESANPLTVAIKNGYNFFSASFYFTLLGEMRLIKVLVVCDEH